MKVLPLVAAGAAIYYLFLRRAPRALPVPTNVIDVSASPPSIEEYLISQATPG